MRIAIANAGICRSRGGAERAAIRLAHELRGRGHEVHLLTVTGALSPVYYVDPCLPVHFFPEDFFNADPRAVAAGPALLREYGIEALVSLESDWKHMLWRACCDGLDIPFICSERITPVLMERKLWNRKGRLALLESCAAIHELLPCYLPFIPQHLRHRAFVIPNAAPEHFPAECPEHGQDSPVLLYLGRFSQAKRPELLLKAFAILAREFSAWNLRLAGWGGGGGELAPGPGQFPGHPGTGKYESRGQRYNV